jgi:DNA-binding transcriptional LysR family regulator
LDRRGRFEKGAVPCSIGFDEAGADFPEASWLARQFENAPLAPRCNNQTGHIAAASAGFGIAMLPHFLAARRSGSGRSSFIESTPDTRIVAVDPARRAKDPAHPGGRRFSARPYPARAIAV